MVLEGGEVDGGKVAAKMIANGGVVPDSWPTSIMINNERDW